MGIEGEGDNDAVTFCCLKLTTLTIRPSLIVDQPDKPPSQ